MPLQNRVAPDGALVAAPERGTMFGNRGGRIHGPDRNLLARRWHSKQWICCVLSFKGRRRPVMAPNRYTEMFFLDEATALSAGHRPCFECRRDAAMQFATLWNAVRQLPGRAMVAAMDDQLHRERLTPNGAKPVWQATVTDLPDATFVRWNRNNSAVVGMLMSRQFRPWSLRGYGPAMPVKRDTSLDVLTPKSIVTVLGAGYTPVLHCSASG
jgi:hypothetical protein